MIDLVIVGCPRPWRAPIVGSKRQNRAYRAFQEWQDLVRLETSMAWGQLPTARLVGIESLFVLERRPGSVPDVGNLGKALVDALQPPQRARDLAVIGDVVGVVTKFAFGGVICNDNLDQVRWERHEGVFIGDQKSGGGVWEGPERTHVRVIGLA